MKRHKTAALIVLYACLGILFYAAVANAAPDVGAPRPVDTHLDGYFYVNATGEGSITGFFINIGNNTSRQDFYLNLDPHTAYIVEIKEFRP